MNQIKKSLVSLLVIMSLGMSAQNNKALATAFNQSYDYEAIYKYDAAITSLTAVYSEKSYELNLRLGWLHYLAGKNKESVTYYKKASALMPASTEALWAMITPLTAMVNYTEVEKAYLAILKIDAKNITAQYNLGLVYYYRKDYFSAKKHLDVALNLAPFTYNYVLMSGWANYFLGNKNEASVLFNKALLLSPNDKSALEGLSLIK